MRFFFGFSDNNCILQAVLWQLDKWCHTWSGIVNDAEPARFLENSVYLLQASISSLRKEEIYTRYDGGIDDGKDNI